jgi:hypothetical protein
MDDAARQSVQIVDAKMGGPEFRARTLRTVRNGKSDRLIR